MKADLLYLNHILEAIERILTFTNQDRVAFMKSSMMQDAVIRNFQIIGEATKRLSLELRTSYPQVQWSLMARTRDRLIHDYAGVRMDILWTTIENDIKPLRSQIIEIIQNLTEEN